MGLYNDIGDAWKEAMKQRDPKKDVLSAIRTEVKNKVINTRSDGPTSGGGGQIDAPDDVVGTQVVVHEGDFLADGDRDLERRHAVRGDRDCRCSGWLRRRRRRHGSRR